MADSLTEGLRSEASHWSLSGDKQLLDVLQGLHQKIIEKCQETNRNLDKMVSALDEASIHLQNVNNKFTSLSNSQFIESRVFDDESEDLTTPEKSKQEEELRPYSEMDDLKRSLQVLERYHETVTIICDSDSESETDDEGDMARVVLKPKDLYAERPLPYIIGSQAWKAKWHAGLLVDESDSESASVRDADNLEQYSDSEPDGTDTPREYRHSNTISSSGSLISEQETNNTATATRQPQTQAEIAAELARRLGGTAPKTSEPVASLSPPSPIVRKLYKPHQPAPGNVFLDEPPPLESDQSEESDDDIFAEINKNQPYNQSSKTESSLADDLFGRPLFDEVPPANPSAKQKPLLFEDESEPELFADKPTTQPIAKPSQLSKKQEDVGVKKPVGGMSLFGSNANAESIGAAILKRNQRQTPSSDEESDQDRPQIKHTHTTIDKDTKQKKTIAERDVKTQKEKERDIFEDLFAKSERINKEKSESKVAEVVKPKPVKPEKKTDLFSDNIFDDIDDIFTTNVKIASKDEKKSQKSIFDDDDDDLFADVDHKEKNNNKSISKNTNVFDKDDGAFDDKPPEIKNESKDDRKSIKETKSIFDDSDDDIFSDLDKAKTVKNVNTFINTTRPETTYGSSKIEKNLFSEDDALFKIEDKKAKSDTKLIDNEALSKSSVSESKEKTLDVAKPSGKVVKSPDIFDDDDDDLFLFQSTKSQSSKEKDITLSKDVKLFENEEVSDAISNRETINTNTIKEPKNVTSLDAKSSIFSDDDESQDDLFSKPLKSKNDADFEDTEVTDTNKTKKHITPKSSGAKINIFNEDDDSQDDLFSRPLKSKQDVSNNFENTKVKSTEIAPTDDKDENDIFKTPDQPVITATIKTAKPNIAERPDVTVINTKITINPNLEPDISQNVAATVIATKPNISEKPDVTVINTKITIKPNSEPNLSQNVAIVEPTLISAEATGIPEIPETSKLNETIAETEVIVKPSVAQKPVIITKTETIPDVITDTTVITSVLDNMKQVDANKNFTNAILEDLNTQKAPAININNTGNTNICVPEDTFSDVFNDQPPVFEKPKEPKKSKNVNALFDDDSDDESLFFKKNDVITDEKPEGFVSSDDRLFGLFRDEPPAIDVDFVHKPSKNDTEESSRSDQSTTRVDKPTLTNTKIGDAPTIFHNDDIFKNVNQNVDQDFKDIKKTSVKSNIFSDDNAFNDVTEDIFKKTSLLDDANIFKSPEDSNLFGQKEDNNFEKPQISNIDTTDTTQVETKKVRKLKPMNFNINVNTLLPGASPKKGVKSNDHTDGQVVSGSNDETHTNDVKINDNDTEPKLVKSVSFEENPDSAVLDNKLSKERAKIQVKRRPSTRRARREAVTKSGIDFGKDSTDNSSSIDDEPRNKNNVAVEDVTSALQIENDLNLGEDVNILDIQQPVVSDISNKTELPSLDNRIEAEEKNTVGSVNIETLEDLKSVSKSDIVLEQNTDNDVSPSHSKSSPEKSVKSKVVYILNDEDIFGNKESRESGPIEPSLKSERIAKPDESFDSQDDIFKKGAKNVKVTTKAELSADTEDIDDIFKTMIKTNNTNDGITTLGQVYKDTKPKTKKLDFLSDSDDENLFKTSKSTIAVAVNKKQTTELKVEIKEETKSTKKSLFDDDKDDALFKGQKTTKEVKKPSLFGSDSDEELFGGNKKVKEVRKQEPKKEVKSEVKRESKITALFEDDDDDGDLFGAKKNIESKSQGSKASKEAIHKPVESVYEDPLSLLASDED